MRCENCNREIPNDAKFCPECGEKIATSKEESDYQEKNRKKLDKLIQETNDILKTKDDKLTLAKFLYVVGICIAIAFIISCITEFLGITN